MEEGRVEKSHEYDLRSVRRLEYESSQVSRVSECPVHDTDNIYMYTFITINTTYICDSYALAFICKFINNNNIYYILTFMSTKTTRHDGRKLCKPHRY